jgi:hypothetical protein
MKRAAPRSSGSELPPTVMSTLAAGGQPLGAAARAFFEPRFNYDFGRVRVHTDTKAAQSAVDIGARAYTVGSNIVFARGQYSDSTPQGKRLMAHELTHVIQQRDAGPTGALIQRAPWGPCPEGPPANNRNPFVYGPAELYAVGQYKVRYPNHCIFTNEMLAAGIIPTCGAREKPIVDSIFKNFHHDKYVNRRSVQSPDDVTRRPESKGKNLIQSGTEAVAALQQPDIVDVTALEVYDITTTNQRGAKVNKFKSRYIPLLNAITSRTWSAGHRMGPVVPLTYKYRNFAICYGETDFAVWPGVIQYRSIKTDKKDTKSKKGEKKKEEKKQTDKEEKDKDKKSGKGKNYGFGIGILSSGGGSGNATFGVAINAHGQSYGTVSAGIVYDANGNAVGSVAVGAGAHISGNAALSATAGASARSSGTSVATAGAGASKDTAADSAATAGAGTSQRSSSLSVAAAGHGDTKDADATNIAKSGKSAPGADQGGSGGSESQGAGKDEGKQGQPGGTVPGSGLEIPGQTPADTQKAVEEAAQIDALLHNATAAQKHLMQYLAQTTGDLQYAVTGPEWVKTALSATKGLSEADIAFLETQKWKPGEVTAEELHRQIEERLRHRSQPQGDSQSTSTPDKNVDKSKEHTPGDKAGSSKAGGTSEVTTKPKIADNEVQGASLDDKDSKQKPESTKDQIARLYKRVQAYKGDRSTIGYINFGASKVYGPASGAFYYQTERNGKPVRVTADVAGILTQGPKSDTFEIRSISVIVFSNGEVAPGSALVGKKIELKK